MRGGDSFPQVPGVEHLFVDAGDLRMQLAQAGQGKPILMLHGWPQHWYLWCRMIPLLAPRARVLCPDLRGFGWTDAPSQGYDRGDDGPRRAGAARRARARAGRPVGLTGAAGSGFCSAFEGGLWRSTPCRHGPPACCRPGARRGDAGCHSRSPRCSSSGSGTRPFRRGPFASRQREPTPSSWSSFRRPGTSSWTRSQSS